MTRPGRPPDGGGSWQSVTSTPARSRTKVEAPPGTTDTGSVPPGGDRGLDPSALDGAW